MTQTRHRATFGGLPDDCVIDLLEHGIETGTVSLVAVAVERGRTFLRYASARIGWQVTERWCSPAVASHATNILRRDQLD